MSKEDIKKEIEKAMKKIDLAELLKGLNQEKKPGKNFLEIQERKERDSELLLEELEPYGLMAGVGVGKPLFIFKGVDHEIHFPVRVSETQAGVLALNLEASFRSRGVYSGVLGIFSSLGLELLQLVFVNIRDTKVVAELSFLYNGKEHFLELLAEDMISFALEARLPFFTTKDLADRVRMMDLEVLGEVKTWDSYSEKEKNGQKYLM